MGHYRSEMMCERCGEIHCTCPPPIPKPNNNFIVDLGWEIMTVDEHDKKYKNANPVMRRFGSPEFKTRKEAIEYAKTQLAKHIAGRESDIQYFKLMKKTLK